MVNAKINGIAVSVPAGTTILEAAQKVQISIPTLCKHPDLPPTAACGICIVRIKGSNKMLRACCTPLEENMEITTHDKEIIDVRRTVIELILSKHPNECLTCGRSGTCELQKLAADFGIRQESFPQFLPDIPVDKSTCSLVLEPPSASRAAGAYTCARKSRTCGRCRCWSAVSRRAFPQRATFSSQTRLVSNAASAQPTAQPAQ